MKTFTAIVGRILFATPMLVFGLMHFMNASMMVGMVPIPGGEFWIYFTGTALIAAALSIYIQKFTKLACLLLSLMLMIFVFTIHLPGVMSGDSTTMQMSMSALLKDSALSGAALILASVYSNDTIKINQK
ncbi:MAG: DoxX family protein [Bacteroidota bacterium]|nr:DoxX family protein [Bacteroidota bacterium]